MTWGPYSLFLELDEGGYLSEVRVQKRVPDVPENEPRLILHKEKPPATPTVNLKGADTDANPHVRDLYSLLQYFESLAGYLYQIDWLDWREPTQECIRVQANGDETVLMKWDVHSVSDIPPRELNPVQILEMLVHRENYEHLVIPLSFFREGRSDLEAGRCINAFFNFYFFLEGLYGGGKWQTSSVQNEFKRSEHIRSAVTTVLKHLDEPDFDRHRLNLLEFLELEGLDYSVDGVIDFLVKLRGKLHHFSMKDTRLKGHPLNERTFRTPALLTMSICCETCTLLFHGEVPH